jgi:hypothetical protein
VPAPLHADLARWAAESGHSVSDEVIAILEREADRRQELQVLHAELKLPPDDVLNAADIIRWDRDHGHSEHRRDEQGS